MTGRKFIIFYISTILSVVIGFVLLYTVLLKMDEPIVPFSVLLFLFASSFVGARFGLYCLDEVEVLKNYGMFTRVFALLAILLFTLIHIVIIVCTGIVAILAGFGFSILK